MGMLSSEIKGQHNLVAIDFIKKRKYVKVQVTNLH